MSKYLIKFQEQKETLYFTQVIHKADDSGDWESDEPEVAVTGFREHAVALPYDVATFIADIFDGEVEEK